MLKFKNEDLGAKRFDITGKKIFLVPYTITQVSWLKSGVPPCPSGPVQVFFNFEHGISKFCDLDDDDPKGSKSSLSISRCVHSTL